MEKMVDDHLQEAGGGKKKKKKKKAKESGSKKILNSQKPTISVRSLCLLAYQRSEQRDH